MPFNVKTREHTLNLHSITKLIIYKVFFGPWYHLTNLKACHENIYHKWDKGYVVVWTTLLLKHVSVETFWTMIQIVVNFDIIVSTLWPTQLMGESWACFFSLISYYDMLSIVDKFATCASLWKLTIVWTQNIGTNSLWTSHLGLLIRPRWTNTHNCIESVFWIRHFKGHIKPRKHYYCKVSIIKHECNQWMICFELLCCDGHKEMWLLLYFISNHAMVN
jgi:hypothetical protein